MSERIFVPRLDSNKIDVVLRHFGGELIFVGHCVASGPLRYPTDGILVESLNRVLRGKTRADNNHHGLITGVKRVAVFSYVIHVTVVTPKLADSTEIRKPRRRLILHMLGILGGAVDEIPLRQGEICLAFVTLVALHLPELRFDAAHGVDVRGS